MFQTRQTFMVWLSKKVEHGSLGPVLDVLSLLVPVPHPLSSSVLKPQRIIPMASITNLICSLVFSWGGPMGDTGRIQKGGSKEKSRYLFPSFLPAGPEWAMDAPVRQPSSKFIALSWVATPTPYPSDLGMKTVSHCC